MLSFSDLDRMCAATLAGAFGIRLFQPENFNAIDLRRLRAGVANSSRHAVVQNPLRAGSEQGKD